MGEAHFNYLEATIFLLVKNEGKASMYERRVENDWSTGVVCGAIGNDGCMSLAEGLKYGLIRNRVCAVSEGAAITGPVFVGAVRTPDSEREAVRVIAL